MLVLLYGCATCMHIGVVLWGGFVLVCVQSKREMLRFVVKRDSNLGDCICCVIVMLCVWSIFDSVRIYAWYGAVKLHDIWKN